MPSRFLRRRPTVTFVGKSVASYFFSQPTPVLMIGASLPYLIFLPFGGDGAFGGAAASMGGDGSGGAAAGAAPGRAPRPVGWPGMGTGACGPAIFLLISSSLSMMGP